MGVLLPVLGILAGAAGADVILLLCHLWGDAHTHLVEPLVAAAITLDPIDLVKSRHRGQSRARQSSPHSWVILGLLVYLHEKCPVAQLSGAGYSLCSLLSRAVGRVHPPLSPHCFPTYQRLSVPLSPFPGWMGLSRAPSTAPTHRAHAHLYPKSSHGHGVCTSPSAPSHGTQMF